MKTTGLVLLLILLFFKIQAQDKSFRPTYNYEGYIQTTNNKQLPIKLNFLVLLDSSIMGSYNYTPQNGHLKLSGFFKKDYSISFFEWDDKEHNTGRFDGKVSKDRRTITGTWTSGDKKLSFPFSLSLITGMRSHWDYIRKYRSLKEYHNIDSAVKHANDVVSVDVADQNLHTLPLKFKSLSHVISTNMLANHFKAFPTILTNLTQLEEISFASDEMSYVGHEIGRLKNLRILILDFNSFVHLPKEIGDLTNLLYLDVSMNKNLKSLPSSIANLKQLQELHIERTSISKKNIKRIKASLPNCVVVTD